MAAPSSAPLRDSPFAHTYSIIARDRTTGEIGVAVQSHWFAVGTVVPWAQAGVGAVATQALTNPAFGHKGLELMSKGVPPREAVERMVGEDEGREHRQLALIDAKGDSYAYTGKRCVACAGHASERDLSVQANMMLRATVWDAMASAFRRAEGPLAERMLAALEAAEGEGGDARGRQSAALVVVRGESTGKVWKDRSIDLRVDDHPEPLQELRRLLGVHRAYESMDAGDAAMGAGRMEEALHHYSKAEAMLPGNAEVAFWHAVGLANIDRFEEAVPLFRRAFEAEPNWKVMVPRLRTVGMLRMGEGEASRLLQ